MVGRGGGRGQNDSYLGERRVTPNEAKSLILIYYSQAAWT